jgi:hypothetical protein
MEKSELITLVLGDASLGDYLTSGEVDECCDEMIGDTGWAFPLSGSFQEYWGKLRTKRHGYFRLWAGSVRKFKVEQIHLGERFQHYGKMIEFMDLRFDKMMEEDLSMIDTYERFGTIARPGIEYDIAGNDITEYKDSSDWTSD